MLLLLALFSFCVFVVYKAKRLMELADRFGVPVITLVDTAGAYPGVDAEERGQAEAIARSTDCCLALGVPTVSVVIGEGGYNTVNEILDTRTPALFLPSTRGKDDQHGRVQVLADAVRKGNDIVVPQPTCSYVLKKDYVDYVGNDDARLVAANKMDVPEAAAQLVKFKKRHKVDVIEISCRDGAGLEKLKKELLKRVTAFRVREKKSLQDSL